jgi:prolyl-tRNA editing enzyme YbaK/EbsC (Cys-tRNA(Pro) deacylase)
VAAAVRTHGLAVEVMPCDPALADTAAFCAAYGVDPADSANTILVVGKGAEETLVACVVLATTRLDVNGAVRRRLGTRKASFAPPETSDAVTGMERGGVTAVGLPPTVPVWVDTRVLTRERVVLGGGNRSSKLRLSPSELARVDGVEVVEGLAIEVPVTPPT